METETTEKVEDVKVEELTDPFAAAILKDLKNTEADSTEDTQDKQTTQTTQTAQTEDKKEGEQVTEPPEEDLIKDDATLKKYDALIKSGFSEEEAQNKVYKEAFDSISNEKDNTSKYLSDEDKQFLVSDKDYENLKNAYFNPPDSALLFHLNNSPELKKLFGGKVESLDLYEDNTANAMFKLQLMESYRRTIGAYIDNIERVKTNYNSALSAKSNLIKEFEDDFFKDYPELNNDERQSVILSSHFVNCFKNKVNMLDKEDQADIEVLKKMFKSAKEEYKKLYPALQKKLGFVKQDDKKVDDVLKDKKLKEMQEQGSAPTNGGNDNEVVIDSKNATDDDFINALKILKKE